MTGAGQGAAAIYCRLSVARFGDTTNVADQEKRCRELCERLGWPVAADVGWPQRNGVYVDNSRSAWQRNRKRPGWDEMLADVGAGKITAIVVYHGDRLVRQPWDLEQLLNLADSKGIKLASPTGVRDLDDSQDRIMLRVITAFACGSSDDTSRRLKRHYERLAERGITRPGGKGGRAFGFAGDGVTIVPAEADLIREAARRILAGEATGSVCRDFTARGSRTTAGSEWTHQTMRKMLARPRYAGLMPDGVSTAAWEPVLARDIWEALCAVLDGRAAGFGYATSARRHLLSGIARCGAPDGDGECGTGLQVRVEARRPAQTGYGCVRPGCRKVQRNAALLDAYVISRLVARLAREDNPAGRSPSDPGVAAEYAALSGQRAEIEEALKDHRQGRVALLMARLDSLDGRLAQLRELAGDDARARLARDHAGITEAEFRELPLQRQRALVSAFLEVTVLPASKRGPGLRTGDLRVVPR